ncbi:MAG: hypothetical protein KAY09_06250 [Nitrospira sp.]|jgi:hypothetical protein|nr:hypothetical protein [Nitrospira sp.]
MARKPVGKISRTEPSPRRGAEPPLWSIAAAAGVIILTPMLLYSIAPEGPIREGDTIFSNGAHKVTLFEPARYRQAGYEATCMLDPKDPLLVTHPPSEDESGEVIIAQVQGKRTIEWPFCPPQAELLVKRHHISQQPSILQDIRDGLLRLFTPS